MGAMTMARRLRGLALLLLLGALFTSGCYESGRDGFICESNDECNEGLYCYRFSDGDSTRRQCAEPGTDSVTGGYTIWGVYMFWAFIVLAPIGLIAMIIVGRLKKPAEASGGPPPGGDRPRDSGSTLGGKSRSRSTGSG